MSEQTPRRWPICGFVPPQVLETIIEANKVDDASREACKATLEHYNAAIEKRPSAEQYVQELQDTQNQQAVLSASPTTETAARITLKRNIYDCKAKGNLPGTLVRSEGQARQRDRQVNNCYDGLKITHDFFAIVFGRDSLDGQGMSLDASVHYNPEPRTAGYNNAFWDGEARQMVFGDGDHIEFDYFTDSLDVIAHELAHAFVQFSSPLEYTWQSGALNESCADVFACMIEQWHTRSSVHQADWVVGQTIFPVSFTGSGLRTMRAHPAYSNDPVMQTDVQPKHMRNLYTGSGDNRGVHINSGIPNHAFYLACMAVGGNSWETVGRVWYATMVSGRIEPLCDFVTFAAVTVDLAASVFAADEAMGKKVKSAIQDAWVQVGVLKPSQ